MKEKLKKLLALLLVLIICVSTTELNVFAEGKSTWDGITTEYVYEAENYKVTYLLTGQWEGGYNANVRIENIGDSVIPNWYISYDSENVISNIWNAEIYSYESNQYVIKNAGWNQDIAVGGSVEFGYTGNGNFLGFPTKYEILENSIESGTEDNDKDGVPNYIEDLFGTDSSLEDTDADGLSDYVEIYSTDTDPLKQDSDLNGVLDGQEDADSDGLTNLEEITYGTNSIKSDSDYDGLSDSEEVNTFGSDPLKDDTDDDGIADGNEILLGLEPLNSVTDGVTPDAERTFEQELDDSKIEESLLNDNQVIPSIEGNVSDNINSHVYMDEEDVYALIDNRATIGKQVKVTTDYSEDADLRLYFDSSSVTDNLELLTICRYEDGQIIPYDTFKDGNTIWTNVTTGIYFVINVEIFLDELNIPVDKYTSSVSSVSKLSSSRAIELDTADESNLDTDNDGPWVILSDYQYVKLDQPLSSDENNSDSDNLTDKEELGEAQEQDLSPFLDVFLEAYDIPEESYEDQTSITVYAYTSNPVLTDTDFDGIDDDKDTSSTNNKFKGKMHYTADGSEKTANVEFTVDYRELFSGNTTYKKGLSVLSVLYASDIYSGNYIEVTSGTTGGSDNATSFAKLFGLDDVENIKISASSYTTDKDDVTEFVVGHRTVEYLGETREIIILSVRGTNGTNAEWSSNFDVGANTTAYYNATGSSHPYWTNKSNHKGFDVTANRVLEKYEDYIQRHGLDGSEVNKSILITGHSRGAAIANLLGAHFEKDSEYKAYTYTFAAPYTTTASTTGTYKTIMNVMNTDDLIPYLPLEGWGFKKYGKMYTISVEDSYENKLGTAEEGTFEWLVGYDYNNDGGTSRTINSFLEIADNRVDLYEIDTSSDGKVNIGNLFHATQAGADNRLTEVKSLLKEVKLLRFCNVYVTGSAVKYVEVNYSPAYLMQNLANMASGTGPLTGYDTSGVYASAKASFVASSGFIPGGFVGGMTHPHMQPTYYLIAYNNFEALED
ncbi:cellulose binding domain-containing protein [Anaerosporobacter sp.]